MHTEEIKRGEPDRAKKTTIIVNAQEKTVVGDTISYESLVSLAYDGHPPIGEGWEFTVTYRRGDGNRPEGSLIAGNSVKLKEGMIFDVHGTDRS